MVIHRDYYGGTQFDLAADNNLAAGPFGNPIRFQKADDEPSTLGNFERSIALFRTASSFVLQARSWLPNPVGGVVWWGPHSPYSTCYVPLLPGLMSDLPEALTHVFQGAMNMNSSYWVHRVILNIAQIKFSYMITDIRSLQRKCEENAIEILADLTKRYVDSDSSNNNAFISASLTDNVNKVKEEFTKLFYDLLFKYSDGYINEWREGKFVSSPAGYPMNWLKGVGYNNGPPAV
jgi:dipeptidase